MRMLPFALATTFAAITPAVAQAQSYFAATPLVASEKKMMVTRDTIWRCAGGTCAAPKSGTRPAILCELLVRETGALQAFSVAGTAFDADALAKCNARAK